MPKYDKNVKSLRELLDNIPKTLSRDYLQNVDLSLFYEKLEPGTDIEALANSLLLEIIDENTPTLKRCFACAILQKLHYTEGCLKIITPDLGIQLVHALPILFMQDIKNSSMEGIVKKLIWCLYNENLSEDMQCHTLAFLCKVMECSHSHFTQDEIKKLSSLLSSWLIIPTVTSSKSSVFRRSSSALSVTEIDGTNTHEFFTVLNYASSLTPRHFRSIQVFSMLKSYLCSSNKNHAITKQMQSFLGGFSSENLCISTQEYCMRIVDQVDRKGLTYSIAEFQKACLVEAIELFNTICLMDPATIHPIFPVIRRIYDKVSTSSTKDSGDISILTSCMQFFINHGSSVMHKPDNLYVYLFCDLLGAYHKDNFISFQILHLMVRNRSQLCYHSSILEKYFPTFFKVLAWSPHTYEIDFLELLPTFMSQQTSVEVFYTLLDLPCLTAILMLLDNESCNLDPKTLKDPSLLEYLKKPPLPVVIKQLLRKTSGGVNWNDNIQLLHVALKNLSSCLRVATCSEIVIPLLKCYFQVLVQYADTSVVVNVIPALLERLPVMYSVENYTAKVYKVLSESILQLFKLQPESVFHCQRSIIAYISIFKNYFVSEQIFIHMVWIIGEYVSSAYSNICRPDVVAVFFENLESTTYEALSTLTEYSDDLFLKFLSVSLTTLSKLAARNQDHVPRAVLCLSKVHQLLKSFGNDYKKSWKIVTERVQELLSILNVPSIAAIVLSPPKDIESGKLHRDSTSLPFALQIITEIVT